MHDSYHVCLDIDVINNDYTHVGSPPYMRFEEIKNTPFLDGDSSDYFCSVVRFTVQHNKQPTVVYSCCRAKTKYPEQNHI
ncbi:MAG: hypothetical protein ACKPKO_65755 [Candidatus Fonsibacter sp.]